VWVGTHRYLTREGEDCVGVDPSSMPKRSGDRIKTDRRDGDALARLHRACEFTAIYIPTPRTKPSAISSGRARTPSNSRLRLPTRAPLRYQARHLCRCPRSGHRIPPRPSVRHPHAAIKTAFVERIRRTRDLGGASREGVPLTAGAVGVRDAPCGRAPNRRWLADFSFPLAQQHVALHEDRNTIDETEQRVLRLTQQLRELVPNVESEPRRRVPSAPACVGPMSR